MWRKLALVLILLPVVAGSIYFQSLIRATFFGVSIKVLAAELLVGGTLAVIGMLSILVVLGSEVTTRRAILLACLCLLVSVTLVETWFAIEESAFRRESLAKGGEAYYRARWAPFESCGLVYDYGTFQAHD